MSPKKFRVDCKKTKLAVCLSFCIDFPKRSLVFSNFRIPISLQPTGVKL